MDVCMCVFMQCKVVKFHGKAMSCKCTVMHYSVFILFACYANLTAVRIDST